MIKKIILPSLVCCSFLFSNTLNEDYLNKYKIQKDLNIEQNIIDKYNFISPLNFSYSNGKTEYGNNTEVDTDTFSVSYSQRIFNFGSIPLGVKYANISKLNYDLNNDKSKNDLLREVYTSMNDLKITELNLQKNLISQENSKIQYKILKDLFILGNTDSVRLNEQIISFNSIQNSFYDLSKTKNNIENYLQLFTNERKVKNFTIPSLETFLKDNYSLTIIKNDVELSDISKSVNRNSFLPSFYINTSYNQYLNDTSSLKDSTYVGFKITMPLDFFTPSKLEKYKLNKLKKLNELKTLEKSIKNSYQNLIESITALEGKIVNENKNIELYTDLEQTIREKIKGGLSTENDLTLMNNSKRISHINKKIYELQKQNLIIQATVFKSEI